MRKIRKDGVIPRFEYEQRAIEFAKYGLDLPQTAVSRALFKCYQALQA